MEYVLFSQLSFGRFTPLLLIFILCFFLIFFKKDKSIPAKILTFYFFLYFLINLGYFFAFSIQHPAGAWGWYLVSLAPLGLVVLMQFAYRFPYHHFKKESYIVLTVTLILSIYSLIAYIVLSLQKPYVTNEMHYNSYQNSNIIPLIVVIFFFWTIILFIRQTITIEKKNNHDIKCIFSIILFPVAKEAKAARNFALLVILDLLNAIFIALFMLFSAIPSSTLNFMSNIAFLIIIFSYVIVYFNNAPEPVSFTFRLVGTALITVLLVIGLVGHYTLLEADKHYTEKNRIITDKIIPDIAEGIMSQINYNIEFIYKYNDKFPELIYAKDKKFILPDKIRFWSNPPKVAQLLNPAIPGNSVTDEKGRVKNSRMFIQISGNNYYNFAAAYKDTIYCIAFSYYDYRKTIHTVAGNLMGLIIIIAAGVGICPAVS